MLKDNLLKVLVPAVAAIVGGVLGTIGNSLLPVVSLIPPQTLLLILGLLLALVVCLAIYIFYLRSQNRLLKSNMEPQLTLKFGIYWDKDYNPYCPIHKTPITIYDSSEFYCEGCKTIHYLKNENGNSISISSFISESKNK